MKRDVQGQERQAGEEIGGRYRLDAHIGAGGMANVWRATDLTLDRPVAVKFLYARDAVQRERLSKAFEREARIAAAVRHRYVVSILDFGTHASGVPYMVMELLEGETLGDLLARRGPLPVAVVVDLVAHVLEGLAAVHAAGIVHRDLKPENIYVQSERNRVFPKLLDFGISRADGEGGRRSALTTHDGQLLGTPQYMSPEQASGERTLDLRTDLYSLGVIMYEALTGRLPFESEGVGALIVQIMTGKCPSVHQLMPEIDPSLSAFVARAMASEPDDRFQDAGAMHQALIDATEHALGQDVAKAMSIRPPMSAQLSGSPTLVGAVAAMPRRADASTVAMAATEPDTPMAVAAAERPPTRGRGLLVALTALIVGGAVALSIALLTPASPPTAAEPRFIVVRGTGDAPSASAASGQGAQAVDVDPARQPPAAPAPQQPASDAPPAEGPPAATETEAETEPPAQVDNHAAAAATRSASKPAATPSHKPGQSLAQTFAQHKKAIGACFEVGKGEQPPKLSLRISLAKSGRVEKAEVLPAAHAGTELGACIRRVAQGIDFGRQRDALSFRVPLTVRVER